MIVSELIKKYEDRGAKFWVEGDQLRYKAPVGVLKDEDFQQLRQYKEKLINYYRAQNEVLCDENNRYETFPITDIQSAYLVGRNDIYQSGGVGCHSYVEFIMPLLDRGKLEKAWHSLIKRHDMLRAIIMQNGYQKVLEKVDMPTLYEQDLRGLSKDKIETAMEEVRNKFSNRYYETAKWPLHEFFLSRFEDKSILHCSMDMLIGDFISVNILFNELLKYYYNPDIELEKLEITYRDVILFLQKKKKSNDGIERFNRDKEYWLKRIEDLPEAPELPIKKVDKNDGQVKFNRFHFCVKEEKWASLSKKAMQFGITPSGIVLAAFAEILTRWSKQPRFCINITLMNRPLIHPQIHKLVGDFTSVDVLEVSPKLDSTFIERAKELQQRLWTDLDHSAFSGVEVLRELSRQRNKNVIIPVVYTGTIGVNKKQEIENESFLDNIEMLYGISQTPQVWLDCQASEINNELHINWDVRREVFPDGMIEDAFESYRILLETLTGECEVIKEKTLVELPQHTIQTRQLVNTTSAPIPLGLIHDGFISNVNKNPQGVAVISEGKEYSYYEVAERAEAVCKALLLNGIKKGDYVAVVQKKGVWQIASILGTLLAGGVYIPLDVNQPVDRQKNILESSKTKYLISNNFNIDLASVTSINTNNLESGSVKGLQYIDVDPNDPAYVIYTSGSTGNPKGVVISHKAAQNTIYDINTRFNVSQNDKIISLSSISFDLSVYDIFGIFDVGGTIVLPDSGHERDPKHWVEIIRKYNITLWNSVPALMTMLVSYLSTVKDEVNLPQLRLSLLSGDWIPVSLPDRVVSYCPNINLISLGGATEASIWSIYYPIGKVSKDMVSIPYGTPLLNQKFYVLNKNLEQCPDWVTGDLYISGEGLSIGYFGDEQLTNSKFVYHSGINERLYYTGDIGRYRPDGIIEFEGREDSQVKINGHRIELNEIETVLQKCPNIETGVVVASGSSSENLNLAAYVEAKKSNDIDGDREFFNDLQVSCIKAGNESLKDVDRDLFLKWLDYSAKIPLVDIMTLFIKSGLFKTEKSEHTIDDIQKSINAHDKYRRLIKRWLNVLCKENFLMFDKENKKYKIKNVYFNIEDRDKYWETFESLENELKYSEKFFKYLKESNGCLAELLKGEVDPLELFFPKGDMDIALAAYKDNLINRSLNTVANNAVIEIVKNRETMVNRPIKILEVGAGVGGTTTNLLPLLKGHNVKYYFTDVSTFFFNEAKIRFKDYDFVNYGLFDINKDYWEQGLSAFSFDIIICGNVLHNSKNAPNVLDMLRELTVPGGSLIVIEATKESYSLLTSLEFKEGLTGFTDSRSENDKTFFLRKEWEEMLKDAKCEIVCSYPKINDPIVESGQSIFINRFIKENNYVDSEVIKTYLQGKLPDYMVPKHIEVLPKIPITSNGKVDRKNLIKREISIVATENIIGEEPSNDLEQKIAKIWSTILNKEKLYRDENFYTAGGDSLLIAQVVAKMSEELPEAKNWRWDDLMREILRNPTVAGISKALQDKNFVDVNSNMKSHEGVEKKKEESDPSLVVFSKAENNNMPLKAIFHAGTGTLTPYNNLLQGLIKGENTESTIVGFGFGDEKEYLSHSTSTLINNLAQKYANILLEFNSSQYELIGYCVGGWIALETARLLLEAGKNVSLVTTISTSLPAHQIDNELLMERAFGRMLGIDLVKAGYIGEDDLLRQALEELAMNNDNIISTEDLCRLTGKYKKLGDSFIKLASLTHEERLNRIFESMNGIEDNYDSSSNMLNIIYKVFSHTFRGVMAYRPELYAGDVLVLQPKDSTTHFFPVINSDNEKLWEMVVLGELKMKYVKGNHLTCMQNPNILSSEDCDI